jgi:hypothetical protein
VAYRAYAAVAEGEGFALPLDKQTGKFARAHVANLLGCIDHDASRRVRHGFGEVGSEKRLSKITSGVA